MYLPFWCAYIFFFLFNAGLPRYCLFLCFSRFLLPILLCTYIFIEKIITFTSSYYYGILGLTRTSLYTALRIQVFFNTSCLIIVRVRLIINNYNADVAIECIIASFFYRLYSWRKLKKENSKSYFKKVKKKNIWHVLDVTLT